MVEKVEGWVFEPEYEAMRREKLEELQAERLRKIVEYCYAKLPVYRRKLNEADLKPEQVKSLTDLENIPFTTKDDLRGAYPFGMLAVGLDRVAEVHASSGTTGHPTTCAYTQKDLDIWSTVMARIYASAGARKGDLVQNAYGYGLFTGGLGFHYGALKVGAAVLPISGGETERQVRLALELGTTILTCTPTYAAFMGEYAREKMGLDPVRDLKWRSGIFGAEPWSEEMRYRIEESLGLEAFDIYGLSEIIGPGVSVECGLHDGLHVFEDHFLAEVVDPTTGRALGQSDTGELVLTTLTKEGMPLLRFRTGDICSFTVEECGCGRTLARMGRIMGRTDDMLKIKGARLWPKAVENAILKVNGASQNYQIIVDRPKILDVMTVEVEPRLEAYQNVAGDMSKLEPLREELVRSIKGMVDVTAQVVLVPPGSLTRFMGKAKRVVDKRVQGQATSRSS